MTRHRCNLKVWALAQSLGGHLILVTLESRAGEPERPEMHDLVGAFLFFSSRAGAL